MAIRWDEFPHGEIRLKIYGRLARNAAGRSAEDSLRHILRRKLPSLNAHDHRRFVELEAFSLVEHLRCTRDTYQEFVNEHNCCPVLEAHWVVLRCAVFPTALELLRQRVIEYTKLTQIPGRDLSLLFGIPTRSCHKGDGDGFGFFCPPDPDDKTAATDTELQRLGDLVEDSLLWFEDIRDGGAVFQVYGGGPFATDDRRSLDNSWALCGLPDQITFIDWMHIREKLWHLCSPWTDSLVSMFASVQEELLSQWRALPADSLVHQLALKGQASAFQPIVVPSEEKLPLRLERGKDCEELAEEIRTIRHKRVRGGLTIDEIRNECSSFQIWKRVKMLSEDDKDTFLHPGMWELGYENLLLGKLYATARRAVAPGTVNNWRKEYRAYARWLETNPSKTADEFVLEIRQRNRRYRMTPHAK
jgi:hypothetical protein